MRWATEIKRASFQKPSGSRVTPGNILLSGPTDVYSYRELLECNAEVASLNTRYSIFYRGQAADYFNQHGRVSIQPSIYRGTRRDRPEELEMRFKKLDDMVGCLRRACSKSEFPELVDKLERTVNCWAIIQHYGLFDTPLVDVSQSLRVACAFALDGMKGELVAEEGPVVYAVALPFAAGPLTLDDNEELYLMKLDALMPSLALRPFMQESYLVGDEMISRGVGDIANADLRKRVIASFRLRGDSEKWAHEIGVDARSLMIEDDKFSDLIYKIKALAESDMNANGELDAISANIAEALTLFADLMRQRLSEGEQS